MNIIEQIKKDILTAAKNSDIIRKDILRLLKGTLDQTGSSPTDDEVANSIKKIIKSNNTTIESMKQMHSQESWADDWVTSYNKLISENEILSNYLPKELDESKIMELVSTLDLKLAKNAGQAVGMAIKMFKSNSMTVNPALVKTIVEKIFNA